MSNSASGIDEILQRWRREIKGKTRRIISFEETAEIKINALNARIYPIIEPLHGWQIRRFRYTRQRCREFVDSDWRPIQTGEQWGGPDISALFKCSAKLPASMKGRKACLMIYFGGDGLLSVNGAPYHGLDPFRDTVLLADPATGNENFDLEAECYIMWHFGENETKTLEISQFAAMDQEMHDTYWDFRAAWNVMTMKDLDQDAREFIKAAMAEAILPIDQNEACPETFRRNAGQARAILRKRLYETDRFRKSGLMHLNGNSHLDVVFLWTHAEFVRKLGRTHATALRLLEQYPDYKFSQSQALMYREMKETYPAMFEQVKAMVKAGRWEIVGATWVEPDCNLISGESFVRQILHGMNFIKREFGVTPRTFWCPDVFGNAWTMPQIIARSGLKYFVTHKMGVWNDTNPWTKNTFWWQGPDGTRVLSLMPPTHFIGTVEPDHMAEHWSKFSDKATIGESLYNFGWGDGGGGPDVEMLEYLKRYREFPGVTPTRSSFVEEALDSIAARVRDTNIPVWNDELYLEEHRGTFTTKARLKKENRKCEVLYRKAEIWALFSSLPYPAEELDAGWKEVLTNQFHDSLPGSHITPVYHDLCKAYERAIGIGERITHESLSALAGTVDTQPVDGEPVVVFNSLAFDRDSTAALEWGKTELHVVDSDGNEMPHQFVEDAETGKIRLIFEARDVPSLGYRTYWIRPGAGKTSFTGATVTESLLENDHLRVAFNKEGEIVS
ncbi:MAG: alpha-mannosidase, partial [Lentisphaerales bacterium]